MRSFISAMSLAVALSMCAPALAEDIPKDMPKPRDSTPGVVVPPVEVPPPNRNGVIEHHTPNCATTSRDATRNPDADEVTICK
jgi:hypothetical protein